MEVHLFFYEFFSQIGTLRPTQKTDFEKKKKVLPDAKIPWPKYIQRESCKKNGLFPTILG